MPGEVAIGVNHLTAKPLVPAVYKYPHFAARLQVANDGFKGCLGIFGVVQNAPRENDVEGSGRERQLVEIGLNEYDVLPVMKMGIGDVDRFTQIDRDAVRTPSRQHFAEPPHPAARVQDGAAPYQFRRDVQLSQRPLGSRLRLATEIKWSALLPLIAEASRIPVSGNESIYAPFECVAGPASGAIQCIRLRRERTWQRRCALRANKRRFIAQCHAGYPCPSRGQTVV